MSLWEFIRDRIRWTAREAASLAFTGMVLFLLLRQVSLASIAGVILGADLRWLLVGCGIYGLVNGLRAVRLSALGRNDGQDAPHFLPLIFGQVFLNNLLPARLGEVAFVYFLKSRYRFEWGEGAVLLFLVRVLDYAVVVLLFFTMGAFYITNQSEALEAFRIAGVAFGALLALGILGLMALRRFSDEVAGFLAHRVESRRRFSGFFRQLLVGFRYLADADRSSLALAFLLSLLIWLGTFGWFWVFLRGLGFRASFSQVVLGSTFAVFSKALPWFTVGGIGAHESGWALGFMLLGWDKQSAIASGFAVNLLVLLSSSIYGLWGLSWLQWLGKSS